MVSGIKNLNEIVFDEDIESHFSIRKIRSHLSSQLFWSGAEIVHQNNDFLTAGEPLLPTLVLGPEYWTASASQ